MSMVTPQHQMCPHCSQNNTLSARRCIHCGKPLPVVPLLPKNFLLANRYRVVSVLGRGGFGAVYLALDTRSQRRKVAVKELLLSDPSVVRQFENEARLLSSLSHPCLPKATDWFRESRLDRYYLVMDFIEGFNLWKVVRKRGVLTQDQAMQLMDPILDAVVYLHTQNPPIIHRDIKPQNILVVPSKRAVYLVDFGIAKVGAAGQRTATGAQGFSPGFSPLEQYSGSGATDERSDIYSLGATFYYLLTGKVPPEATERIQKEMAGQPSLEPICLMNPSVTPQFEAAIFQAMAVHKEQRFPSVQEFRQALKAKTLPVQVPTQPPKPPPASVPPQSTPTPARDIPPIVGGAREWCPNCRTQFYVTDSDQEWIHCPNCGQLIHRLVAPAVSRKNLDPAIAGLLSSLIPGIGQIYNEEYAKGISFLIGYIFSWIFVLLLGFVTCGIGWFFLFPIPLAIWIWSIVDAIVVAQK